MWTKQKIDEVLGVWSFWYDTERLAKLWNEASVTKEDVAEARCGVCNKASRLKLVCNTHDPLAPEASRRIMAEYGM